MPDRTINWGDSETEASYRTQDDDPAGGGNFVVVEDLDGGLIPLQYNPTSGKVETAVPIDTGSNDITTTGEVSAGTLEANGMTKIKAVRNASLFDVSVGTFVNIIDTVNEDNLGEVNANQQFVPNKSGEFDVDAVASTGGSNVSEGDKIRFRVRDVSNSETLTSRVFADSGADNYPTFELSDSVELISGNVYEIQLTNARNNFKMDSNRTKLTIKRSIVQ